MKSLGVILFAVLLSLSETYGQNFFATLHSGYGFGTSPQYYNSSKNIYDNNGNYNISNSSKSFSFGEGLYVDGSFGYYFNANIGAELDLQYSNSSNLSYGYSLIQPGYSNENKTDAYSNAYLAIPSIIFITAFNEFKPYLKIGAVIGMANLTYSVKTTQVQPVNTNSLEAESLYNGGLAFGYNTAIGIEYKAEEHVGLILEIDDRSLSYAPTKGKLNKDIVNGEDHLSTDPVDIKETDFVDEINYSNGTSDPNKPSQQLKSSYPFSSVSISVGVKYNF